MNIDGLADELLAARDAARLTPLPSRLDGLNLEQGYAVGRALHERLLARGWRGAGRKIGFTNPATWREFGVDAPMWAHMYAQTVRFASRSEYALSLRAMVAPRIEPEVVLKLRAAPSTAGVEAMADCIDWVAIGFEIVDSHFADWRFSGADAVADFGVHAALIIGTPWQLDAADRARLVATLPALKVMLRRGSEVVAEGEGRNALGSPLLALAHLANLLATQPSAPSLTAGEIITTGTLTPLPYVRDGERWTVEVEHAPLGALSIEFREKSAHVSIRREDLGSPAAQSLILALNAELSQLYPEPGANHFRLNADEVAHGRGAFLVARAGAEPVGCGAIRLDGGGAAEIKRMYVVPAARGCGIARAILAELEIEARRLGAIRIVLETGGRQPEALALYASEGFSPVPACGEYVGSPLSVCMAKHIA